jgi:hypothetical protein
MTTEAVGVPADRSDSKRTDASNAADTGST